MEEILKKLLSSANIQKFGKGGGGCINHGQGYLTDSGSVFVKENSKPGARLMFEGEFEGLKALNATGCIRVPKPIKVIDLPGGGAACVMEYIEMRGLGAQAAELGQQLARLHLHNASLKTDGNSESGELVTKFGFHVSTCCGYIPQDNTWHDDWPTFYSNCRLCPQIEMAVKEHRDTALKEKWSKLEPRIPGFFGGIDIFPSLLHGDLWSGNAASAEGTGEPVIFDPAVVYGHHEFDLAIATMFGGFGKAFFNSYHKVIPKSPGFERRQQLYRLFHYLNHYNHFGSGYRGSCLEILDELNAADA
ncbi:fructosamine-3-kinase-like [Paramacrobiotus metropolitanus]|uniref:fructosamine-3-kinase-like n=1 Tax=Paramacrobiotus metropolitanus TaxID=2943436 RepID=UPI002445DA08|nr:fructosamine-3-kinase-like [Paramacrobiotus metropolitanus]